MGRGANTFTNTRSEVMEEPLAKWANSNLPTPGVTSTWLEEAAGAGRADRPHLEDVDSAVDQLGDRMGQSRWIR